MGFSGIWDTLINIHDTSFVAYSPLPPLKHTKVFNSLLKLNGKKQFGKKINQENRI